MCHTSWSGWRTWITQLCLLGTLGGLTTAVAKDGARDKDQAARQPAVTRAAARQETPRNNRAGQGSGTAKQPTGNANGLVQLQLNSTKSPRFQPQFQGSNGSEPAQRVALQADNGANGGTFALAQKQEKDNQPKPPKQPKNDTPKPPKVETPKPPKTEAPKPPKTEAPKPPKTEAPKPPKTENPKPPKTESPKPPKTESPKPPKVEPPKQPKPLPPASEKKPMPKPLPPVTEKKPDPMPLPKPDNKGKTDRDNDRTRPGGRDKTPETVPDKNKNPKADRENDRDNDPRGPRLPKLDVPDPKDKPEATVRPDRNLDPKVRKEREEQALARKLEVPRVKLKVDQTNEKLAVDRLARIPRERLKVDIQKNGKVDFDRHPELRDAKPQRIVLEQRFKDGDFRDLINGRNARAINLDRQFALRGRGDVARQMNLFVGLRDRGGWQHRHFGLINRHYTSNCFGMWYSGPSIYGRYLWYPSWSGWVSSCWWDTCDPFWDPRPIYCRPIVYRPAPIWIHWHHPAWQPLPIVVCGTWIDVPPVVVQQADMQLLAVRFVDPGHPEQELGPRYRVWLRNNTPHSLEQPFNVMLLASNDREAFPGRPEAGVRIARMDAGETQAVDIRLPYASQAMGFDDEGRRIPFQFLHVLVDSHNEIAEPFEANNGLIVTRDDVFPVDPAAFAADPASGPSGRVMNIAGEGFGPEPGQALVVIGGQEVQAEILGWYDLGVQLRLPDFVMSQNSAAELVIVRGDGAAANPVDIEIAPSFAYLPASPRLP